MAVVPTTHTFTAVTATTSEANSFIRDPLTFLLNPPLAVMRQSSTQSLTTATWTSVTFDVEDFDQGNAASSTQHSTSVNTSRFTAVWPGIYHLDGATSLALNATGARGARWAVNGTALTAVGALIPPVAASFGTNIAAPGQLVFLAVGDFVELQAFQASGGSLSTSAGSVASVGWKST